MKSILNKPEYFIVAIAFSVAACAPSGQPGAVKPGGAAAAPTPTAAAALQVEARPQAAPTPTVSAPIIRRGETLVMAQQAAIPHPGLT